MTTSCLRFSLSKSKNRFGQCLEREKSLSSDEIHKFLCWFREGDDSCGWPWRPFCLSNTSQTTGCSSKPETVWILNAASLEAVCPFLVSESITLTYSARLLVQMDTGWTHRPWLYTWSWHSVIALSKIINGKLSVLHLQSDSLNFMSKTYVKDPSCILHRAGYQHSFSQRTWPFPPPIYPSTCLKWCSLIILIHWMPSSKFNCFLLFGNKQFQMEIPDFLLKWAN